MQRSFSDLEYAAKKKVTRLDRFLGEIDVVTPQRIARGQALLAEHQALFDEVENRYGVPRQTLAAFWSLETSYGSVMGNTPIPPAIICSRRAGEPASRSRCR